MRSWIKYISSVAILSFVFYQLAISFLPNVIYGIFHHRVQERTLDNQLYYVPLPTDESRVVVMPNPDFLYISCFYDLSDGPLHFTGVLPDSTYWSLAFYQPNTVNWYVKNDKEFATNQLDLILAKQDEQISNNDNVEIAHSPVNKGFALFRILVTDDDPEVVKQYETWQKSVKLRKYLQ